MCVICLQQALEATCTSLQRTELLSARFGHYARIDLNSLRIRVEARAYTAERAVIDQQIQFMQTTVQPLPCFFCVCLGCVCVVAVFAVFFSGLSTGLVTANCVGQKNKSFSPSRWREGGTPLMTP